MPKSSRVQGPKSDSWVKMHIPFIGDLAALQQYIDDNKDAIFVSLDIKGRTEISEIGLSVLPPSMVLRLSSGDGDTPPFDMARFADMYNVQTYTFRVNGRHEIKRGDRNRRPILQFGTAQWVDATDLASAVAGKLTSILDAFSNTNTGDGTAVNSSSPEGRRPPLVLVVYNIGSEAYYLDKELILVRQAVKFAAYVAVTYLITSLSLPTKGHHQSTPNLRDASAAAGLYLKEAVTTEQVADGVFEDIKWRSCPHSLVRTSGNDTVWKLGLLAHMLYAVASEAQSLKLTVLSPLPTQETVSTCVRNSKVAKSAASLPVLDNLRALARSKQWRKYYQDGPTEEQFQRGADKRIERIKKKEEKDLVGSDELESGVLDDLWANGD
ncbi:hypothetical protein SPBR_01832 [Sporothrix brasiliensis 5110]|uniref:Uncharacterized protein n=1 Tax=Sporothrix brasiliensis 5110 TaxID=1398154 RepID=A0A0C2IX49_9PEZI|nr:uncharacterized protein SPBR_01832 [Sporothrix brasiliensis 5110]KIH91340.1 hypothetical protein SPBR_01832 [Sporothrix brasiliensis 5110]